MPQRVDIRTWRLAIRHPHGPKNPTTRGVLHALATWGDPKRGDDMFPSVELIAVGTGYHRQTVSTALDDAEREGFLIRERIYSGGQLTGYRYFAAMPDDRVASNLREWERDPQYKSERRRRGRSVPEQIGDASPNRSGTPAPEVIGDVLERIDTRPRSDCAPSPISSITVPEQIDPILSRTSSKTSSTDKEHGAAVRRSIDAGDEVQRLFEHWKATHDHEGAKLTPNRRRIIRDALKHYSFNDLYRAIGGYSYSKFHKGDNDRRQRYDWIETILRDAQQIERGIELWRKPPEA